MRAKRIEKIKCISCRKEAFLSETYQNWRICSVCQAYFCEECVKTLKESKMLSSCPSSILQGIKKHKPKFVQFIKRIKEKNKEKDPTVKTFSPKTVKILKD